MHSLRAVWKEGVCALNGWLLSPSMLTAEHLAYLPWDSLLIDLQHGAFDYQRAYEVCAALGRSELSVLARVPSNEPGLVGKLLDLGADGIMCPMIESRADAEAFVASCRYPPRGSRSFGPVRAAIGRGGPGYIEEANEAVVTIAQIETARALGNLEEIVGTPGLDAIYVGSADLSISLGGAAVIDHGDRETAERHRRIIAAAHSHRVKAGVHVLTSDDISQVMSWQPDLISLSSDLGLMMESASALLSQARDARIGGCGAGADPASRSTADPPVGPRPRTPYEGVRPPDPT